MIHVIYGVGIHKVSEGAGRCGSAIVNEDQFDFHSLGDDAFYVNGAGVSGVYVFKGFCQSCKIRGKLHKYAVFLHGSDYSCDGLTCREGFCVLFPCAEELTVAEVDPLQGSKKQKQNTEVKNRLLDYVGEGQGGMI